MKRLEGRTIAITRAEEDTGFWADQIRELGGQPYPFPCIHCEAQLDGTTIRQLWEAVSTCDWLVMTSPRGVRMTRRLLYGSLPERVRIAVVGPNTAAESRRQFGRVDLEGDGQGGEALGEALVAHFEASQDAPPTVVIAAADRAHRGIDQVLESHGVALTRVSVYRTVPPPERVPRLDLANEGVDTVLLASPSAVEGLLRQASIHRDTTVITIGPTTTKAARAAGLCVTAEAEHPDLEGMLEQIHD